MVEVVGFEPTSHITITDGFQDRCLLSTQPHFQNRMTKPFVGLTPIQKGGLSLVETERFELSELFTPYGFQNRCLRPLGHVSYILWWKERDSNPCVHISERTP